MTDDDNSVRGSLRMEDLTRDGLADIVSSVDVGDELRVHFTTGLPHQSCLQAEETTIERMGDGRFHYVNMLGDPFWFDEEELVDEITSMDIAEAVEVLDS